MGDPAPNLSRSLVALKIELLGIREFGRILVYQ